MPRPTTKQGLIELSNAQYNKLFGLIDSLSIDDQLKEFDFDENSLLKERHWKRDKNIRDVLVHLYEWHNLLLNWVKSNQEGTSEPFIPSPYNWKTYGDMNEEMIWAFHQETTYDKSRSLLKNSHSEVMKLLNNFSDEELFTRDVFPWIGSSTFGSYFISVTSSHYDWAIKKIKKHANSLKK